MSETDLSHGESREIGTTNNSDQSSGLTADVLFIEDVARVRGTQSEPELLRVIEAARMLSLSRTKVYEMAERGEIPVVRIGSAVRVPRRKLLEWIEAQTMGGSGLAG